MPAAPAVAVGHSLGGVLVSHLSTRSWHLPTRIDAVAAPLAGMGGLGIRCGYEPPASIDASVEFHQWRTRHELDNAFNNLDEDPQLVSVKGMGVTTLPDDYRGHRLGHNWSISWVADQIATND